MCSLCQLERNFCENSVMNCLPLENGVCASGWHIDARYYFQWCFQLTQISEKAQYISSRLCVVCVSWNVMVCENSVVTGLSEICPSGKFWPWRTVLSLNVFVLFHVDNVWVSLILIFFLFVSCHQQTVPLPLIFLGRNNLSDSLARPLYFWWLVLHMHWTLFGVSFYAHYQSNCKWDIFQQHPKFQFHFCMAWNVSPSVTTDQCYGPSRTKGFSWNQTMVRHYW